jgi:hypothetical protein
MHGRYEDITKVHLLLTGEQQATLHHCGSCSDGSRISVSLSDVGSGPEDAVVGSSALAISHRSLLPPTIGPR